MIRYMQRADAAGGEPRGEVGRKIRRPYRTGGAPRKGKGRTNCYGRSTAGRGSPSSLIPSCTLIEVGGDWCISTGGKPPDCVKAYRAAAVSTLASTVAALSSLFRDVLRLLRSGLVHTFLSEGESRYIDFSVRPDSRTGVLLSAKDSTEVLVRLGLRLKTSTVGTTPLPGGGSAAVGRMPMWMRR